MSWPVPSGTHTHTLSLSPGEQEQLEQTLETKREAGISLKLEIPSSPMSVVP